MVPIEANLQTRGAPYDRKAALYDWLVRSTLYNRLLWGTSPRDYEAFADKALASGSGSVLDVAGGSAAATARPYAHTNRPITLTDQSIAMLNRAATRISAEAGPTAMQRFRFVQADAFALPFSPNTFQTVICMGFVHLLPEPMTLLKALKAQVAPGGSIFLSSLVAGRSVGTRYLHLLHSAGEVAVPRTVEQLSAQLGGVPFTVQGNMAYAIINA